jgi:hypothetical protein
MANERTLVVLGAADPEMAAIAQLAEAAGARVYQARVGNRPVRPGELVDTQGIDWIYNEMIDARATRVLLVELHGKGSTPPENKGAWVIETYAIADNWPVSIIEIDHHDPNQTWPPEMPLWERSSIGQAAKELGVQLDERQKWIGALDHDLPGALRLAREQGKLDEVLMIYASGASHLFGGVPPETYVEQARATANRVCEIAAQQNGVDAAGWVNIWQLPPDPKTAGATGEHYPLPALPLALALAGRPGLSVIRRKDGALAWRLQCATSGQVQVFLAESAGVPGVLRGVQPPNAPYGFPERGLAGGTLTPAAVLAMPWGTKELYDAQVAFLAPKSDVSAPR